MIPVTRLKGQVVAINPDLIETIEETPDTTIRLTSGDKILVRESLKEVIHLVIAYRKALVAAFSTDPMAAIVRGTRPHSTPPVPEEER